MQKLSQSKHVMVFIFSFISCKGFHFNHVQHMSMYNHGAIIISLTFTKNIPSIIFSVILLIFSNAKQLYKHICSVVHEIKKII